ncbi:AN1-type zinc finger protein 6 isoform X1 [Parambassis ranga]|uniref:AN1-type zinc finger protein 6 isoform X1 n=1 Tax=Parambassis ranga TaxID=210632 RepID=A0A6P7HXY1_9TELE|nr:AN1-type zinc finger protein 6 isoform X1 [Parambassis ranga]XP_028258489.1 AN1-type zinc finger protein 6 isoform X1 [Parambassis ranga]XP_028258490.1 AN1-type zinc finger protein 6 isoform X1 [Parambassis ranga]
MAQETKQSQTPLLCSTGCGFYGNPRNNGMCSVCYKDFLQRQNSSGCVSPSARSTSDSIKDSLLAQCSQGTTDASPADTESGHCSGSTTEAPATSEEENTSGAKTDSLTDDNLSLCTSVRATAIGSEQESQCSAGVSSPQRSVLVKQGFHKNKKRKREDLDENDGGASVSDVSVDASAQTEEKPKAKKNRSFTCQKKVGLTGLCTSVRATAIGSEQESQCSAGVSSPQRSVLVKQGFHQNKKRKREDLDENDGGASVSDVSVDASAQTEEKPKAKKNRCFTCRKKVGLIGFDCRCGNMFCSMHRYSDVHNCTFNYQAEAAEKIRKENPVIVAEKIQKI